MQIIDKRNIIEYYGNNIYVEEAEIPEEIIWQNMYFNNSFRFRNKIILYFVIVILVGLNGSLLYLL